MTLFYLASESHEVGGLEVQVGGNRPDVIATQIDDVLPAAMSGTL